MLLGLALQGARLSLELGDELVAGGAPELFLLGLDDLSDELLEGDEGVHHDRLHVGQVLEGRVEVHGVEDAEAFLADVRAEARGTANHLLIENAAAHAAQEDQVGNRGDVDACGEQVDGDGDVRRPLVAVAPNGLEGRRWHR